MAFGLEQQQRDDTDDDDDTLDIHHLLVRKCNAWGHQQLGPRAWQVVEDGDGVLLPGRDPEWFDVDLSGSLRMSGSLLQGQDQFGRVAEHQLLHPVQLPANDSLIVDLDDFITNFNLATGPGSSRSESDALHQVGAGSEL